MGARKLGFLGPIDALDWVEIGNGMYFHVCSDYRSRIFNWAGNYSGIGCVSRKSHVQCVRGHKIDELWHRLGNSDQYSKPSKRRLRPIPPKSRRFRNHRAIL